MKTFDAILNWKLLQGSHEFPGPDGGTCINEAAVIAAGMQYRKIETITDCPPCFCPALSLFALRLNDCAVTDYHRNELLEFVTRLPGSADTSLVQAARDEFIVTGLVREIMPIILRRVGLEGDAGDIIFAGTTQEAQFCVNVAGRKVKKLLPSCQTYGDRRVLACVRQACRNLGVLRYPSVQEDSIDHLLYASYHGASWSEDSRVHEVWDRLVEILRGAFAIGKQADPLDIADVKSRLDEYRHLREYV